MKSHKVIILYFAILFIYSMVFPSHKVVNGYAINKASQYDIVEAEELPSSQPVDLIIEEEVIEPVKVYTEYRLTSFWNNDGYGTGSCTGSGLCEKDFQVNSKGWYTYNGKLVLASATEELLRSGYNVRGGGTRQEGKHYFRYYDEVEIVIDDVIYKGIILDSCGAAMWTGETRMDLFVSSKEYAIDRGYKGHNPISVFKEE